ncbi:MAG: hypothetical protein FWD17_03730 [Polyangiaceae bacterium]|nr:hypothetical protein [Polyangiaceae bacterium]
MKVIVIDLPLPPWLKRWSIRVGVVAGILAGASLFAFASVPHSWSSGEKLTAMDLNDNFTSLDSRIAALESALTTVQMNIAGLQSVSLSTIQTAEINAGDPTTTTWGTATAECFTALAFTTCNGSTCPFVPVACLIAAERNCVDGLGFRFGFFVGDNPSSGNSLSIVCIK